MGGKSQEIHNILYNFLQKPGLWKDNGAEKPALEASAPGKNGEDLTSEELNGLGLPVRRLNLEKLLIRFELRIHKFQSWGVMGGLHPAMNVLGFG